MKTGTETEARTLSTGDKSLDNVLRGGLPVGALTAIYGLLGTGKSMLGSQLCRAAAPHACCVLPPGRLTALAARSHLSPGPTYVELGPAALSGSLPDSLEVLDRVLDDGVQLLLFDGLSGLFRLAAGDRERLAWLDGCIRLLDRRRVAGVALYHTLPGWPLESSVGEAATLVIRIDRGDQVRPRQLVVEKYEGSDYAGGAHAFRITAQGLVFDAAAPTKLEPSAVSGVGSRILSAFRTARRATASDLAQLLGGELDVIHANLAVLVDHGYLTVRPGQGGHEDVYELPSVT